MTNNLKTKMCQNYCPNCRASGIEHTGCKAKDDRLVYSLVCEWCGCKHEERYIYVKTTWTPKDEPAEPKEPMTEFEIELLAIIRSTVAEMYHDHADKPELRAAISMLMQHGYPGPWDGNDDSKPEMKPTIGVKKGHDDPDDVEIEFLNQVKSDELQELSDADNHPDMNVYLARYINDGLRENLLPGHTNAGAVVTAGMITRGIAAWGAANK